MPNLQTPAADTASRTLDALSAALLELGEAAFDVASLMNLTVRKVGRALGGAVLVSTVSPDGNWLVPSAMFDRDPQLAADYLGALSAAPARVAEGEVGHVISSGISIWVPRVDPESWAVAGHEKWHEVMRRLDVRSLLILPMRARGKAVGAFSAYRGSGAAAFCALEHDALQRLADALGAIIARQLGEPAHNSYVAQTALQEREEQLRLATEAAEVGLWDVDMVTDTLFWPPRVKAMFGISPGVSVSMADFYAGVHPADRDPTVASFVAACDPARRAVYDVEYRTVGKEDGAVRWVAAKGRGIFDAGGKCVRVIGTAIDISKRKANEAALIETQERLRAADRRKDEFLAIMGHELRNPLAPLMTAAHIIRSRGGQASEKEMGVLDRQLRQMSKIVADLLQASSAMREDVQLALRAVEISELLAGAVDLAAPFIEERGHQLSIDVPARGLLVNADAERMAQVFGNVLHNAAKYTPPGGRLRLSAASVGGAVEVMVEDDGQGISPEVIDGIFDLFTQGEAGKQSGAGLGIGLAVSRKLILAHGGKIQAQSQGVDRGSRFLIQLPRARQAHEQSPSAPRLAHQPAVARRILIADDHLDTVELMETLLEQYGHQLRTAMDGPSALQACEDFKPEIVFLDIGLPGMDGYEVATRMRALPAGSGIMIVAVSGHARDEDRARALASGFSLHLAKPFDVETLANIIDSV